MSCRVDTTPLIAGACVVSLYAGHGILGDDVPSTGADGAAVLYDDITLPGEAADEFRALLLAQPTGTFTFYADSSFEYDGAGGPGTYQGFKNGVSYGTATFHITIGTPEAPAVTSSPSDETRVEGNSVTFSATFSGNYAPTRQWQRNNGVGWVDISGATSNTYTFTTTILDDAAMFRCVGTNAEGSATTAAGTLTVTPDPNGPPLRGFIIDPIAPGGILWLTQTAQGLYHDPISDRLYLQDTGNVIRRWNHPDGEDLSVTFKTGVVRHPHPTNPGYGMVVADTPVEVHVTIWADGSQVFAGTVVSGDAFPLPSGYLAQDFQAQLVTTGPVQAFLLAEDASDFI